MRLNLYRPFFRQKIVYYKNNQLVDSFRIIPEVLPKTISVPPAMTSLPSAENLQLHTP